MALVRLPFVLALALLTAAFVVRDLGGIIVGTASVALSTRDRLAPAFLAPDPARDRRALGVLAGFLVVVTAVGVAAALVNRVVA